MINKKSGELTRIKSQAVFTHRELNFPERKKKANGERSLFKVGQGENGAGDEVRTHGLDLGKVALYQLSYARVASEVKQTVIVPKSTDFL